MCFKSSVQSARFSAYDWLDDFDTRIIELPSALTFIVQALMVLTIHNGKSLAPFLESALFKLDEQMMTPLWCFLLMAVGLFQLGAFAVGTRRKTYLLRWWSTVGTSFISLAVVLALLSGPQPWIVALFYSIRFFAQTFALAVLYVKHQEAKAEDDHALSLSTALASD